MPKKVSINVGLVGVTGYTGMELVRILAMHPLFELKAVTSRSEAGKLLGDLFPFLSGFSVANLEVTAFDLKKVAEQCEIVFLAIPHGAAMDIAAELIGLGCKVIDLSADFRIKDVDTYNSWYGVKHSQINLLKEAVYGLPEIYFNKIKEASLIANPGCYPTATLLGLYPAFKHNLISHASIVIDAKSGTSGAGRGAKLTSLYCEVADNFKAYGLGTHRHTPEIEQELSNFVANDVVVSFNPHLLPVNRGILATIYTNLLKDISVEEVYEAYLETYKEDFFVRILKPLELPELKNVRGSMFCDIGLVVDKRSNRLIIVSVIDNLCRGASGQAIANANIIKGLEVDCGLRNVSLIP